MLEENNIYRPNYKKIMESVTIFQYYLSSLFPRIFTKQQGAPNSTYRCSATQRNIQFHYAHDFCVGVKQITPNILLKAVKQIYFPKHHQMHQENCFGNTTRIKLPFLPIQTDINEHVCFFLSSRQQTKQAESKRPNFLSPHKQSYNVQHYDRRKGSFQVLGNQDFNLKLKRRESRSEEFSLYIIHLKNDIKKQEKLYRWENFIEKYQFTHQEEDGSYKPVIIYDVAFSVQNSGFFSISQSQKILELFYETSIFGKTDKPKYLEQVRLRLSAVIQEAKLKISMQEKQVCMDPVHRRELKLTKEQKQIFQRLKVKTFVLFSSMNRSRQVNRYFLQNLICRMMQNSDFKEEDSLKAIEYYLTFQSKMRKKYQWSDFAIYDRMNIFTYIGKDYMGRPILLNRMRNVLCSQIQDFDLFFDYHMYLFEIYMQDQMEGWVDQFIVISDASNQISDNTNLGFSKKIIFEALKLCKRRHYKMITFDISMLGTILFNIVKGLLPTEFIEVIKIFGDDRQQLLKELTSFMPLDVIPEFLGGRNPTIDSHVPGEDKTEHKLTEVTSQKSIGVKYHRR